jgi:large subunit ribosomal protein L27
MAHKKAGGSKARQGVKVAGKRLGVKIFSGEKVHTGQIIIRQRGTKFHPGEGVRLGRDHTLFSAGEGTVAMRKLRGKNIVDVKNAEG